MRLPVAALAVLLALAAAASAAIPAKKDRLVMRDHGAGPDRHLELSVSKDDPRMLESVVLYLEQCDEAVFAEDVPIAGDGTFRTSGKRRRGRLRWTITGQIEPATHAHGTYAMSKRGKCSTGTVAYDAESEGTGTKDTELVVGNQDEYLPPLTSGSRYERRVRRLRADVLRNAPRFDTVEEASALGYRFDWSLDQVPCPGMQHMRKHKASFWGRLLNPRAPQSLVFWCSSDRRFTLAAFMFRGRVGRPPTTIGNLLQWHRHGPRGTWMTHVWLLPDTVPALATCVPFTAFERFGSPIRYEPFRPDIHIDRPCSDTPGYTPPPDGGHHHG